MRHTFDHSSMLLSLCQHQSQYSHFESRKHAMNYKRMAQIAAARTHIVGKLVGINAAARTLSLPKNQGENT